MTRNKDKPLRGKLIQEDRSERRYPQKKPSSVVKPSDLPMGFTSRAVRRRCEELEGALRAQEGVNDALVGLRRSEDRMLDLSIILEKDRMARRDEIELLEQNRIERDYRAEELEDDQERRQRNLEEEEAQHKLNMIKLKRALAQEQSIEEEGELAEYRRKLELQEKKRKIDQEFEDRKVEEKPSYRIDRIEKLKKQRDEKIIKIFERCNYNPLDEDQSDIQNVRDEYQQSIDELR